MVYWGLTPQQQPGSYQGGEMMMMKSVLVEETGVPGGNHRPTAQMHKYTNAGAWHQPNARDLAARDNYLEGSGNR